MPILAKGQRVGSGPDADRWQVVRKLGEGAFAEVYEVKDTRQDADGQTRVSAAHSLRAASLAGCAAARAVPAAAATDPADTLRALREQQILSTSLGAARTEQMGTGALSAAAQFAMKLEKRADARSVRQEYKVRPRDTEGAGLSLQAGALQAACCSRQSDRTQSCFGPFARPQIMKRVVEHCPQVCPVLYGGQYQDRSYMVMQVSSAPHTSETQLLSGFRHNRTHAILTSAWDCVCLYVCAQLLGMNLVDLRRGSQGARLEGRQMRQVASSMLDAIQAVHAAGFIHRCDTCHVRIQHAFARRNM